uniref:Uncharacterized protein n=1 Tax=Glossina palpalis gambiensis TaxID=67801 RepID=A0A1B0B5R4_9MUSC
MITSLLVTVPGKSNYWNKSCNNPGKYAITTLSTTLSTTTTTITPVSNYCCILVNTRRHGSFALTQQTIDGHLR